MQTMILEYRVIPVFFLTHFGSQPYNNTTVTSKRLAIVILYGNIIDHMDFNYIKQRKKNVKQEERKLNIVYLPCRFYSEHSIQISEEEGIIMTTNSQNPYFDNMQGKRMCSLDERYETLRSISIVRIYPTKTN